MKNGYQTQTNEMLKDCLRELDELSKVAILLKAFPESPHPQDQSQKIKTILNNNKYRVLASDGF
ncbi:hypothetical protein DSCOOX_24720 [Desulfosarcina ovata subsp. ovata]|uniref:Uncharacterized protein n=1 Tax=Desulfosarcina ovata subsp. ovata TaxID=2752305 RepID=A0A5K8A9M1_9BACT|nr:hypothetical protein DSCOOX_24720 [Desulfosarcina ovata subsp. ovata]